MTKSLHQGLNLSRRNVLQNISGSVLGLSAGLWLANDAVPVAADEAAQKLTPLNRFPRMVQEYYAEQLRILEERTNAVRDALKTKEDGTAYVQSVREKIRKCFGPEPERTPLKARTVGFLDRETYKVEKVIYESRPGFQVTANLYLPKKVAGKSPGVVGSCGHARHGKADETYQAFAQSLARMGYVVLIFDPIGQGERVQYLDDKLNAKRGVGVPEHLHGGNQQFLVGEFFGSWRAWDGIRSLDYLLSRPEVDPRHVGITGNSGGGTMTTWLSGLEQRWTMSAPGCFVTTFRRNLENELPADTEQIPPHSIALGLDHSDFLAAMAPKPVIILAKEKDYFDVRGAIEAYRRLKHLYEVLGAPDNVQLQIGPTGHGYTIENREAMYRFFNKATQVSDLQTEPKFVAEKHETLWCTPRGQVSAPATEAGGEKSRTMFSFTQEKSRALAKSRKPLTDGELVGAVQELLQVPKASPRPPEFRILRVIAKRGYQKPHATTYAVATEPGIFSLVTRLSDDAHYSRPPVGKDAAILYVADRSSDDELRNEALVGELIREHAEVPFFACDVRGVGDSKPNTCGDAPWDSPYGSDYFYAAYGLMMDRPMLGQRTYDVLRAVEFLGAFGHKRVHVVGKGWGALPAMFAALLSETIVQVTLKDAPESYSAMAEDEDYEWPLALLLSNVLEKFDLPDCYRLLEKRKALKRVGASKGGGGH